MDSNDLPASSYLFDGDQDHDVDLVDFALFQLCFTGVDGGPYDPPCVVFDGDTDDDVDGDDLAAFVLILQGPG